MTTSDVYLAKPFNNSEDAPDLVIAFCQVLAGLRRRRIHDPRVRRGHLLGGAVSDADGTRGDCDGRLADGARDAACELFRRLPVAGHHMPPTFTRLRRAPFDLRDASVDRIMCLNAFHHVPNPAEVLKEMARVLRPGGIAGFSEPGDGHSRSVQAQYEMRNYTVVENDIVIEDIERWALDAGFSGWSSRCSTRARTASIGPTTKTWWPAASPPSAMSISCGRPRAMRRAFFLYKAGATRRTAVNAGVSADRCSVTLDNDKRRGGRRVHGRRRGREYRRECVAAVGRSVRPGRFWAFICCARMGQFDRPRLRPRLVAARRRAPASRRASGSRSAPPAGDFRLGFDLVSEQVCWFEMTGSGTVTVDVSRRSR